jgi:cytochrome P450
MLRPRIQSVVDELIETVRARRAMDLVHDFAYPLPVIVIAELLGIPAADRAKFKQWSDTLTALLDPLQARGGLAACEPAFAAMSAYLGAAADERRRAPRDDLISALVAAGESDDALTPTELVALCGLILGAGHETTTNLIGNAVLALLRHPAERRRLQDEPSLIGTAVEEFLRYDSPVQATDRVCIDDDVVLSGCPIARGAVVLLLIGAANRDPAHFAEPDRFDVGRSALLPRCGAGARRGADRHPGVAARPPRPRRRAHAAPVEAFDRPARSDRAAGDVVTGPQGCCRPGRGAARRTSPVARPSLAVASKRPTTPTPRRHEGEGCPAGVPCR